MSENSTKPTTNDESEPLMSSKDEAAIGIGYQESKHTIDSYKNKSTQSSNKVDTFGATEPIIDPDRPLESRDRSRDFADNEAPTKRNH